MSLDELPGLLSSGDANQHACPLAALLGASDGGLLVYSYFDSCSATPAPPWLVLPGGAYGDDVAVSGWLGDERRGEIDVRMAALETEGT
jgi:hypothetical protein